jgi:DNA-binding NtrC family response regulator
MSAYPSVLPVVLVDDEPSVLLSSQVLLGSVGIKQVLTVADSRGLLPLLAEQEVAAIVLDLFMPHVSGMELLPELVQRFPQVPVIVMTASQEIETAVASMKEGAFDYLVKPVEESRFVTSVKRALEVRNLRQEVGELKRHLLSDTLDRQDAFAPIVTASRKLRALFQYVEAIARSNEPVLICGETGVGKELLSQAVHRLSGRPGNFVQINVAGLDDTLFSDTLFGHKRGAYTGAAESRDGLVAQAAGGTLFLDEIGDLKTASQVKLLRLLQEQTYYPLGSDVPRNSDVRLICATNQDLHKRMLKGRFRSDLYFRLSVHQMEVPPLRERKEDIPVLVAHFVDEAARSMDKQPPNAPSELFTLLATYHFPGNVRELRAMVYDAVALHRSGPVLAMESFRSAMQKQRAIPGATAPKTATETGTPVQIGPRFPTLKEVEDYLIGEALSRANGNQGIAATLLGISRPALNRRLARQGETDEAS